MTSEEQQAVGRADIIAKHVLGVFVFELKVDESADAALAQIAEKGYCLPYLNSQQRHCEERSNLTLNMLPSSPSELISTAKQKILTASKS